MEYLCIGVFEGPHWTTLETGKRRYEHLNHRHEFVPVTADLNKVADLIAQEAIKSDIYVTGSRLTNDRHRWQKYARADLLLADLDDNGEDGDKVDKLVELGGLVLSSGTTGHGHLWLPIDKTIEGQQLNEVYTRLRQWLGSDPTASNPVGFGRLAGTLNHKGRVSVHFGGEHTEVGVGWDGACPAWRVSLAELEGLLPPSERRGRGNRTEPPEEFLERIKPSGALREPTEGRRTRGLPIFPRGGCTGVRGWFVI